MRNVIERPTCEASAGSVVPKSVRTATSSVSAIISLTQETLGDALGQLALVKLGLLDDQDLLNVIRMIQKDPVLKGYGHANDVAVLACDAAQRAEGVLANCERQAEGG